MYSKNFVRNDCFWLFSSVVGIAVLYLGLIWKTTENINLLTTDCLFWGAILWLLWQKKDKFKFDSSPVSSFIGLLLLGLVLAKSITLFQFESIFLSFLPILSAIALALIASGFRGLSQYLQELFLVWFIFFPAGTVGYFIETTFRITVINAKIATYLLYYLGFNTLSNGNEVILQLSQLGEFKAIVNYSCTGLPMIILLLKLGLLLISCVNFTKQKQLLIIEFSLFLGFLLGIVRVCLLTLLIPNQQQFYFWHGMEGTQIFSTLSIVIFSGFCYQLLSATHEQKKSMA